MEPSITQLLPNLGIAGFAIWIMWKMYDTSQRRFKEKDQEFIGEINKRDASFRELEKEVRTSIMSQLAENTNAMSRVIDHINLHQK